MRQIGTLSQAQAQLFGDYLVTQGIDNELETRADDQAVIWVYREDRLASARALIARFLATPEDAQWQESAVRAQQLRDKALADEERRARNLRLPATQWQIGNQHLTWALIAACVAVTLISDFGKNHLFAYLAINHLAQDHALFYDILHGQIWRLVTPILIHLSPMHLLFNVLWLHSLGRMIESRQGWRFLAVMVGVLAVLSNCAQYLHGGTDVCGMSGVVYGLFAYVWVRGVCDRAMGYSMSQTNVLLMLMWMVLCMTGTVGPIANIAHGAGLAAGAAWGALSAPNVRHRLFGK